MKKTLTLLAATAALVTSASAATTILIDYDDGVAGGGHDAAVRNGGFETNGLATDSTYAGGAAWTNGTGDSSTSVYKNLQRTGAASALASGVSVPTNDTGHTIAVGDVISLSFWARSNNTTARDISWSLGEITGTTFTPFTSGGTATVSAPTGYTEFTATKTVGAGDALIGESLAVQFERVATAGFPRIDDVSLSVESVPEPSSAALLGLGGLALILRRRK